VLLLSGKVFGVLVPNQERSDPARPGSTTPLTPPLVAHPTPNSPPNPITTMTTAVQTNSASLEVAQKIGGKRIRVPPRVSLGDLQVAKTTASLRKLTQ